MEIISALSASKGIEAAPDSINSTSGSFSFATSIIPTLGSIPTISFKEIPFFAAVFFHSTIISPVPQATSIIFGIFSLS